MASQQGSSYKTSSNEFCSNSATHTLSIIFIKSGVRSTYVGVSTCKNKHFSREINFCGRKLYTIEDNIDNLDRINYKASYKYVIYTYVTDGEPKYVESCNKISY
jgi:hypothetical protein